VCEMCARTMEEAAPICPVCTREAVDGATHFRCRGGLALDGLVCGFEYKGVVRKMVSKIKYKRYFEAAGEMVAGAAGLVEEGNKEGEGEEFRQFLKAGPTVVPVPMFWLRENVRGFNQAEVVAKILSNAWELEKDELLVKIRETEQVGKGRKERTGTVRGVFEVIQSRKGRDIPKRVLLVDDVWTTGATMRECGKILKRAGVREVWGWAIAR